MRWLEALEAIIDAANGEVDWRLAEKEVRIFVDDIYPGDATSAGTMILKHRVLEKLQKKAREIDAAAS